MYSRKIHQVPRSDVVASNCTPRRKPIVTVFVCIFTGSLLASFTPIGWKEKCLTKKNTFIHMRIPSKFASRSVFTTETDEVLGLHLGAHLINIEARIHMSAQVTPNSELNNIRNQRDKITIHRSDPRDKHSAHRVFGQIEGHNDLLAFHLAAPSISANRGSDHTRSSTLT